MVRGSGGHAALPCRSIQPCHQASDALLHHRLCMRMQMRISSDGWHCPIRPRATTTMLDGTVRPSRVVPAERASRALLCVRLCASMRLCVRACSPGSGAWRLLGWSKSISSPTKRFVVIEYIRSLLLRPAAHQAEWMPPRCPFSALRNAGCTFTKAFPQKIR